MNQQYQVLPVFIHIPDKASPVEKARSWAGILGAVTKIGGHITLDEKTSDKTTQEPVYTRSEFDALPDYEAD